MLFLKNGREAELEADRLGVEYGSGAGYDPAGVPRFLSTLARVDALSERGVPNWLSTHPDPGSRVTKAEPVAGKFVSADAKKINRDQYLERIQGLVFGDNPKDGIVRGNEFLHPLLRIGVKFPEGWELTNTPQAVMAQEPGTRTLHGAAGSGSHRSPGSAARHAIDRRRRGRGDAQGRLHRRRRQHAEINGNEAHVGLYRGNAKGAGKVMMRAAHIAIGRQLYVVAGFAPEAEFALVDRDIQPALQTFRQLSDAGSVERPPEPRRLLRRPPGRLVAVDRGAAGQGIRQCGDARDHERSRGQRSAAARRPRQDRRRRVMQ